MNTPFRVASTTALTNEHLPSPATYVLVDNTTNQWLYQPDAQRFIAPYAMNVVLPLALAAGANMQVTAPTGLTQAAPIAGQQYLATFSDAAQPGYPYTSQMDVAIAGGTVDANILNSSLNVNANITGGTVNANITNSTIDANISNSKVDINNVTPNIEMSASCGALTVTSGSTTQFFSIPVGDHIRGWTLSSSAGGQLNLYFGPSGSAGFLWWSGVVPANTPVVVIFAPGLSISAGLNNNYVWVYAQTGGNLALSLYHSAT